MISDYSRLDEVGAIALGGSSAVKSDDTASDFDVYIYCVKEPSAAIRREIAQKYSDNPEIDNHYFETGDVFYLRETGKPVDIMYRTLDNIKAGIYWVWTSVMHQRVIQPALLIILASLKYFLTETDISVKFKSLQKHLIPMSLRKILYAKISHI